MDGLAPADPAHGRPDTQRGQQEPGAAHWPVCTGLCSAHPSLEPGHCWEQAGHSPCRSGPTAEPAPLPPPDPEAIPNISECVLFMTHPLAQKSCRRAGNRPQPLLRHHPTCAVLLPATLWAVGPSPPSRSSHHCPSHAGCQATELLSPHPRGLFRHPLPQSGLSNALPRGPRRTRVTCSTPLHRSSSLSCRHLSCPWLSSCSGSTADCPLLQIRSQHQPQNPAQTNTHSAPSAGIWPLILVTHPLEPVTHVHLPTAQSPRFPSRPHHGPSAWLCHLQVATRGPS